MLFGEALLCVDQFNTTSVKRQTEQQEDAELDEQRTERFIYTVVFSQSSAGDAAGLWSAGGIPPRQQQLCSPDAKLQCGPPAVPLRQANNSISVSSRSLAVVMTWLMAV